MSRSVIPVLVSQRLVQTAEYPELREALDVRWGEFLSKCGILPVPVSLNVPIKSYFASFRPKGILLTGGNDLASVNPSAVNRQRDDLEKGLVSEGVKRNIPIIGVCRGMQMLAFHYGASLEKRPGHVGMHRVQIEPHTKMAKHYKNGETNSYHNFCVSKIPKSFKLAAVAENDGSVEAMVHRTRPVYAMMWHPERFKRFRQEDIKFFKRVFSR